MARKKKHIHYLYKTTCIITNRWYIGIHSTINLEDGYLGSGKRLRHSIRKYGKDNHIKEILEFFESRELLIEAEKKAITEEMLTDNNCMNLMIGGNGGLISKEHHEKMLIGLRNHQKEKWKDVAYREKILSMLKESVKNGHKKGHYKYDTFKGKTHSEETKKKMSESAKGKGIGENNSQYGTCWITKDCINKKIKKDELEIYLKNGWFKGRKYCREV